MWIMQALIGSAGSVVGSTDLTRAGGALLTWEEAQRPGAERRALAGDGGDVIVA